MNDVVVITVAVAFVAIFSILGVVIGDAKDAMMIFGFSSVVCGQLIVILRQLANEDRLKKVNEDVKTIEKATNHMKDALVQAAGDVRFLEGKEEERKNPETKKG